MAELYRFCGDRLRTCLMSRTEILIRAIEFIFLRIFDNRIHSYVGFKLIFIEKV